MVRRRHWYLTALRGVPARVLLAVAVVTATITAPAVAGAASGVPTNGDFEEPVSGTAIPGWTQVFGRTDGFDVVTDPVASGAQSLHVADGATDDSMGLRSDPFPVVAGNYYAITAQARVVRGAPMLYLYFYDAAGERLAESNRKFTTAPGGGWFLLGHGGQAPEGAASAAVMIYSGLSDVSEFHVDDVHATHTGTTRAVGTPVRSVTVFWAAFGRDASGRELLYGTVSGSPAQLVVLDADTGRVLRTLPLTGSASAWGLAVAPDGTVWVGGAYSRLYRWRPGDAEAKVVAQPTGQRVLWDLAVDARGRVYGGTYPDGKVFQYDPATGQTRDYGTVDPGAKYVRSLDVVGRKVYAGLGTPARFYELDVVTGAKREIPLPERYRDYEFGYTVTARHGRVYVWVTGPDGRTLVYDVRSRRWVDDLGSTVGKDVSPVGPNHTLYFIDVQARLMAYNTRTGAIRPTGVDEQRSSIGFGTVHLDRPGFPGATVVSVNSYGEIRYYNPKTGAFRTVTPRLPSQPGRIHALATGPDGRVYASGYIVGGLTAYDPATGEFEFHDRNAANPVGQAEDMFSDGRRLYVGTYTGAQVLSYDPAAPYEFGTNPRLLTTLKDEHQDRPYALTTVGDTLAVGTVPVYGSLHGALTLLDPATGQRRVYRDIVPEQSVVALASVGGLVYGGTSIKGGLGIDPTQPEAKLFAVDPVSGEKVWEGVPLPGQPAITALAAGPDGHLWGASATTLFEFDPATNQVLRTKELFPYATVYDWFSTALEFGQDGQLYGMMAANLVRIDPATLRTDVLVTGATTAKPMLARLAGGETYFARDTELYQFQPAEDPGAR